MSLVFIDNLTQYTKLYIERSINVFEISKYISLLRCRRFITLLVARYQTMSGIRFQDLFLLHHFQQCRRSLIQIIFSYFSSWYFKQLSYFKEICCTHTNSFIITFKQLVIQISRYKSTGIILISHVILLHFCAIKFWKTL